MNKDRLSLHPVQTFPKFGATLLIDQILVHHINWLLNTDFLTIYFALCSL